MIKAFKSVPGCELVGKIISPPDIVALEDAGIIINKAQQEADRIIAKAHADAITIKNDGYQDGWNQAKQEASRFLLGLYSQKQSFLEKTEEEMVKIVIDSVRKVIFELDPPKRTVGLVKNALRLLRNQKELRISVGSESIDILRTKVNEMLALYPAVTYIDVVLDERLEPDHCILESEIGRVDASIEIQLEVLEKAFIDKFKLFSKSMRSNISSIDNV